MCSGNQRQKFVSGMQCFLAAVCIVLLSCPDAVAANTLVFTTQPSTTVAGSAITPAVVVSVQDGAGHTVTTATNSITITFGSNPGGGTLAGTVTVAAVNGVATFDTLSINKTGVGYTLSANASGCNAATSGTFNITAGPADKLAFSVQPTNAFSCAAISPAVKVAVQDALGNTVTTSTSGITLAIGANPGSTTLGGTTTVAASAGLATFSDLNIDTAGNGYTLVASATGLTGATSNTFNITYKLLFNVQPTNTVAGEYITPAIQVVLQDGLGNTLTSATNAITMAIGTNPGGGTLSGTKTVNAVNGIATFGNLSINKTGSAYTLVASATGFTNSTSGTFNISPAVAAKLAFTQQPTATNAGATMAAVKVTIQDTFGNTVTSATDNVTVAIGANPGSATLSGTLTVAAVSGVASFNALSIDKAGTGYTLTAACGSLTGATSSTFNITYKLVFRVQPSNVLAGDPIAPAVEVKVEDALGNVITTAADNITIAIGSNPGSGTLSGTKTLAASNGVADFSDLSINKIGNGYTLTASAAGMSGGTSNTFNVNINVPFKLFFTIQPPADTTIALAALTPALKVAVQDKGGNTVTTSSASITLSINDNPGGSTLGGTLTIAAINGVATFSNITLNKAGVAYTLLASSPGLQNATSTIFNVKYKLVFLQQPTNVGVGQPITPAVTVAIQDAVGNTITDADDGISMALNTHPTGSTLSGTSPVSAVSGVATFSDLSVDTSGTYTLTASSPNLVSVTSSSFVASGGVFKLKFTVQPVKTVARAIITPALKVAIQDAGGNTITTATDSITLAINNNPSGGTLSGMTTVAAVNGVATFSDLSIDLRGSGYTLIATATGLVSGTSNAFDIVYQLVFTAQPTDAVAGSTIPPLSGILVSIEDGLNNVITTAGDSITMAIGTNPGGGTLSGTKTVGAISGVATFSTLGINKSGIGYKLTASGSASQLNPATSAAFNIVAGTATMLAFTVQPSSRLSNVLFSPAIKVAIEDTLGNTVLTATDNITISIGTNPSGGTLAGTVMVGASNGVATFSDLSIDKAGTGYKLSASSGTLTSATSNSFDITYKLAFTTQPSNAVAGGAITPAVQVTVQDGLNNTVTAAANSITVAIGTNPGGGTLLGTKTVAASSGVASFSDLSIAKAAVGYTLTAAATGMSAVTSAAFDINMGPPSKLAFVAQPGNTTAGAVITPAVQVQVQDAAGNIINTASNSITLSIGTNPGGGTLSGTTTRNAVNGVAVFNNISVNRVGGGYTLVAHTTGLTDATSSSFNISAGPAARLGFTVQPVNTLVGSIIAPAVSVAVQDSAGNTITTATNSITIALGNNPGGATLSGTTTLSPSSGVATFNDLLINKPGAGCTLSATTSGLTAGTSDAFNISYQLVFTAQPTTAIAGATMSPAVQVSIKDGLGSVVTTASNSITVSIGTNPGGGTLAGTTSVAAVNGVATFNDLSINKTGTGYTLSATGGSLTGATSAGFDITPGTADHVAFIVQPSNALAAVAISPAIQVAIQDALGNVLTGASDNITVAIAHDAGGGTLTGSLTVAAVNGVATFNNLKIDKAGTGYTLSFTCGALPVATSAAFDITYTLAFTTAPVTTAAGASITPAVQVSIRNGAGATVTNATDNITIAIANNPGSGTLSGTATVAAIAGVATFSDLGINRTGSGYTLNATCAGAPGATSAAFDFTPGAAAALVFTVQPANALAGATLNPAIQVTIRDALGNTVTGASNTISLDFGTNPNPGVATLGGTTSRAASNGVATFNDLSVNMAGVGYTLAATATGLAGATSGTFNISYKLAFTTAPSNALARAAIAPAVQIALQDNSGATMTTATDTVTLAIAANPGSGTLGGTLSVAAVSGVATFNDLNIDKAGNGYTLAASAPNMNGVTSTAFNISYKLAFTTQPSNTGAASAITPAVQVTVQNALGSTITTATDNITIAIGTNPSSGSLSGTTTVTAASGVATFSNLKIDKAGTGYTLTTVATGMTGATSSAFDITYKLAVTTQPSNTVAGATIAPTVQVTVQDGAGATVTSATNSITLAIANNPGGGTLAGTLTVSAVNGVAAFNNLSISKTGTGYTLGATATGIASATSNAFNITPGAANKLAFAAQPTSAAAGVAITPAVQVAVQDSLGNTVTTATTSVTIAIVNNPGGGMLGGTVTANAVNGVATFNDLSINKTGTGYTLSATGGSLTGATSAGFDITPGTADHVAFIVQPSNALAAVAISPAIQVAIQDALGNVLTGASDNITVAIAHDAGGGTLTGSLTVAAVNGVATFNNLKIDKAGTGYTLSFTCGALPVATSAAFNISAAAAAQLAFTAAPAAAIVNGVITPAVAVVVQDSFGNTVTAATNSITVALASNPPSATLSGTTTVSASSGSATFSTLSINKPGTGFTFSAAATGLAGATSAAFDVTYKLAFTTQPSNAVAGGAITPAVQVAVQDATGATIATAGDSITLALANNPGGATLSGVATVSAVNGVATFSGLSLDRIGTGYTLSATATGETAAVSAAFNVAYNLAFTVQPTTAVLGSAIAPAVQVTIRDALGNTITSATNSITVAIDTNPGSGTLSGTATVAAVSGVATFSNLRIDKAGTGYTLAASAANINGATSAAFNIRYALGFSVQPVSTLAASPTTPAVQVAICDASGNAIASASGTITLALGANPGGGTLSGTLSVATVNGVATFSGLKIDRAGTGYTLLASSTGLPNATSSAFDIRYRLAFVTAPSNTLAAAVISPAVTVAVQDGAGTAIASATNTITLALGANPGSATLGGTVSAAAASGAATFSSLTVNRCGSAYTLVASAAGLDSATSPTFDVTYGLAFTVQPSDTTVGTAIQPAVQVAIRDALGNTVSTARDNVTLRIGNNPAGATLQGTATVAATSGVATFSQVSMDKVGSGFTLTVSGTNMAGSTSSPFNVAERVAPAITSALTASATQGAAFIYQISASGSTPMTFGADNLPAGLGLNGDTISGTPTVGGVVFVTIKASNIAGSDSKTLQLTITKPSGTPNNAPAISSPPTANSPTGTTGQPATFTAAGTDSDGDILGYTWNFGDGTTGAGASASHVYAAPGIYTVTVTISDGTTTTQQQTDFVVSAGEAPVGDDNGGDDTWGSSGLDAFSITKGSVKLNFTSGSKDTLQLSGTIPVAKFFKPAGKKVTVLIGGLKKEFMLTAKGQGTAGASKFQMKGKMKKGVFKATPAKFTLAVKGEPLLAAIQEFGFADKTTVKAGEQVDMSVIVMLDTLGYEADITMVYKAVQGKSGKAAKAK